MVDWGDGSSETITSWDSPGKTHTYATPDSYIVTIAGTISGWSFSPSGDNKKILEITNWGALGFGDTSSQFHGCSNLTISATDTPDLSGTTSFFRMFSGCGSLTAVPSIERWDTSNITDMSAMFMHASLFNQSLAGWDTSKVTNMNSMFSYCTSFNGDISNWDVSQATNMNWMFLSCSAFNRDISIWDTGEVTDMVGMFNNAVSFNQDLSRWDTGKVINMAEVFFGADSFNHDISDWNTSSATDMSAMFGECAAFNQDISAWDTSNVTTMSGMFRKATSFDQDLSSWSITKVENMGGMFEDVTLSTSNYDAVLIGWEGQSVLTDVQFDGGLSKYSAGDAAAARARLISDHSWTISDGGEL